MFTLSSTPPMKTCMETPFERVVTFLTDDKKPLPGVLRCVANSMCQYVLTARMGEVVLGIAHFHETPELIEIDSLENNTQNDITRARLGFEGKVHKIGTYIIEAIAFAAKKRKKDISLLAIDSHPFYLKLGFKVMTDPKIKKINRVIRKVLGEEKLTESELRPLRFAKESLAAKLGVSVEAVTLDTIKRYGELCEIDDEGTRVLSVNIQREYIRATLEGREPNFLSYVGMSYMILEC